jgi:hypothetical protein
MSRQRLHRLARRAGVAAVVHHHHLHAARERNHAPAKHRNGPLSFTHNPPVAALQATPASTPTAAGRR